ncbi:DUF2061 domain-containing protein [Parvibaculum sp.]|jgi:uncharacterized membrane protein|uniref:DUF2061 domain-containing protein n=1 Tax=Parvibaculum sp. TaxID=2024848 RepID=UPI001B04454A|nr:DUF2061 domain-containing protein [Parvibaculum sp.]MBO6636310.1 DUF2061 domain-containing protein [Parvibaculum sp.]MBO6677150.1 DUF2061 domain-containing protein [Parvibaculum sp.]MBO6683890.1 DUF2061 domain-containing protein [Parvibaculum sp.]MBO6905088.1 DUF2061 domain-containing protein [Parvibaculum sp.]
MRDILKTISYGSLHFTVGFGVVYLLTGEVAIAAGVALIEPAVNTVVFYFHEKAWARLPARALQGLGFRRPGHRGQGGAQPA